MPPNVLGILAIYGSHDNERQYVGLLLLPGSRSMEVHLFAGWLLGGSLGFTRRMWESSLVHYTRHLICFIIIIDFLNHFLPLLSFAFSFLYEYSSQLRQSARNRVSIGKWVWGKRRS